jgi:hypothetical protein
MRVVNVMMGKRRGGLERAVADPHEALTPVGCEAIAVVQPSGALRSMFAPTERLLGSRDFFAWDFIAPARLRARLADEAFDVVVVAHGNDELRRSSARRDGG